MSYIIGLIVLILLLAVIGYTLETAVRFFIAIIIFLTAASIFLLPGLIVMSIIVDINSYNGAKLLTWTLLIGVLLYVTSYGCLYFYDSSMDNHYMAQYATAPHIMIFIGCLMFWLFSWLLN